MTRVWLGCRTWNNVETVETYTLKTSKTRNMVPYGTRYPLSLWNCFNRRGVSLRLSDTIAISFLSISKRALRARALALWTFVQIRLLDLVNRTYISIWHNVYLTCVFHLFPHGEGISTVLPYGLKAGGWTLSKTRPRSTWELPLSNSLHDRQDHVRDPKFI